MADLRDKLSDVLNNLQLEDLEVDVRDDAGSFFATVISRSFVGMNEAARQELIWEALRGALSDEEQAGVEFVFTLAPNEWEQSEQAV